MTLQENQLSRAHTSIEQALKSVAVGTTARVRRTSILVLALEHAEAWANTTSPSHTGERGGTTTPQSADEAFEDLRVHQLALRALERIPFLAKRMDDDARELHDHLQRLTSVTDHGRLPGPTGCKSCARAGHFAPIYEKAKASGLCRWCRDVEMATGSLPPVKAVDICHRQGARAAGRWIAEETALQPLPRATVRDGHI